MSQLVYGERPEFMYLYLKPSYFQFVSQATLQTPYVKC